MQFKIFYEGINSSPWVEQLINQKGQRLSRYLSPGAVVNFHLKMENQHYQVTISFHWQRRDYAFSLSGTNLYQSVAGALEKASRGLSEEKRRSKDRIAKRSSLIRDLA